MARKRTGRAARWEEAASEAREVLDRARNELDEAAGEIETLRSEYEAKMQELLAPIEGYVQEIGDAFYRLAEVQAEYQDWYDNLPEGLQQGATGEKLEAVTSLDLEPSGEFQYPEVPEIDLSECIDLDEYENALGEAEGAELPVGWGRD
jgi:hypothetical protein